MLEFILSSLAAVFVVMDPLGAIPVVLVTTEGYTTHRRNAIIRRACWAAFFILIAFALLGALIFRIFGISFAAFRVAGGILLLKISLDMLYARRPESHITNLEEKAAIEKEDVAIVPLAMPMLSGPASIATVLVLMEKSNSLLQSAVVIISIFVVCFASYIILRSSGLIFAKLKETGVNVMVRILGLILLALSVQFMFDGIKEMFFK
jgi:multiple antibiotic resistance protein